jgi:hypothetical protein
MFPAQASNFHVAQLGDNAKATPENNNLSCPSPLEHDSAHKEFAQATTTRHWGTCLPRHFDFGDGTVVCARLTTRPDLTCIAISVLGAGEFRSGNDEVPVKFEDGAIIIKRGEQYKCVSFEVFRKHFVSESGNEFHHPLELGGQAPMK